MGGLRDPAAEPEVDFRRYARAVAGRWWLLVVGLLAGGVAGVLVATAGQPHGATGKVEVYVGTPLASGNLVSTPPVELALVDGYVTSAPVVARLAGQLGVPARRLRISTVPVLGVTGGKTPSVTPIVEIEVAGVPAAQALAGAALLGQAVQTRFGARVRGLISTIGEVLRFDEQQLAAISARLAAARATQAQILASRSISATDKLVSLGNLNSVITQALSQQLGLSHDRFSSRLNLGTIETVSAPALVVPAHAERAAGRSRASAALVGAALGLLLAVLTVLAALPLSRRRRAAGPAPA